jgi:hypothetical protein
MSPRVFFSLICLSAIAAASSAHADVAERRAAAQALFDEGRRLMSDAAYSAACAKFQASYELDPGLGTLLHQADCYEKVGRLASAWSTFELAIGIADERADVERGRVARVRAAALEARLPRISIELASLAPDTEVLIDGHALPEASIGALLPLDPGEHLVEARAHRHRSLSRVVELREGETPQVVRLPALIPIAKAAARRSTADTKRSARAARAAGSDTQSVVGVSAAALGLAGVAAAGGLGVAAHLKNQSSLDECRSSDTTLCSARGVELREQARNLAAWSTGTLIAGASLLGAGAVIYLTASSKGRSEIAVTLGPTSCVVARSF